MLNINKTRLIAHCRRTTSRPNLNMRRRRNVRPRNIMQEKSEVRYLKKTSDFRRNATDTLNLMPAIHFRKKSVL